MLQDFITKYTGVADVGDTPENKGQCTGLIEVWFDILNINTPHLFGNAKDLLSNADSTRFDIIYNNPNDTTQFPLPGDVICWNENWGNGYGHTGVVVTANGNAFTAFEQNNPTGHAPQIVSHVDYSNVIGWLHPKVSLQSSTIYKGIDLTNVDSVRVCVDIWDAVVNQHLYITSADWNAICIKLGIPTESVKDALLAKITELQNDKITAEANNTQLTKQIPDLEGQIGTLKNEVAGLEQNLQTAQTQADLVPGLKSQLAQVQFNLDIARQSNIKAQKQISDLSSSSARTISLSDLWKIFIKRSLHLS